MIDETLFEVGNFGVRWYSVMLLIAIAIAVYVFLREGKKFNFDDNFLFNLFFWTVVMGFVGARTYYVIFNFNVYQNDIISIFKIWEGGLAIHGGILAGLLTIFLYCKKYNVKFLKIADMGVLPLLIGQAIGRWGNFFNHEAHGAATTFIKLKEAHIPEFVINNMKIRETYYVPTFYYESIWCFVGAIIVLVLRRFKYVKVGNLTAFYLMWYSAGRFFIEKQRTDSLMLGGIKVAQLVSVILFMIGLGYTMLLARESKFENLYNEKNTNKVSF